MVSSQAKSLSGLGNAEFVCWSVSIEVDILASWIGEGYLNKEASAVLVILHSQQIDVLISFATKMWQGSLKSHFTKHGNHGVVERGIHFPGGLSSEPSNS